MRSFVVVWSRARTPAGDVPEGPRLNQILIVAAAINGDHGSAAMTTPELSTAQE
jgi:hypothetical protein